MQLLGSTRRAARRNRGSDFAEGTRRMCTGRVSTVRRRAEGEEGVIDEERDLLRRMSLGDSGGGDVDERSVFPVSESSKCRSQS